MIKFGTMSKRSITAALVIFAVVMGIVLVNDHIKNRDMEKARAEYAKVTADEVIGGDIIGDLDRTTYDADGMCIKIENSTLTTVAPNLDGDEVDFDDVAHDYYLVTEDTKFYTEDVHTVIQRDESQRTTITYQETSLNDIAAQVAENTLPATMHIWLDDKGRASIIMMYGGTTIWE